MECPFCTEEISELSLACGRCGKDISFLAFRQLREQLDGALARVMALETAVHTLSAHADMMDDQARHHVFSANPKLGAATVSALAWIALPIVLLMLAHWTIISVLDLNTWVLRVVSILIPLPFGLRHFGSVSRTLWAALFIAIVSIAGMLVSTSIIDHVDVLPEGTREWTEIVQYAASIWLSYLVGSLLGWHRLTRKLRGSSSKGMTEQIATVLANGTAPPNESLSRLHGRVVTIASWLNAIMVMLTAAGAVYTALGKFWSPH